MGRSHYRSEPIFCATIHASANIVGAMAGAAQLTGFDKIQADQMNCGSVVATQCLIGTGGKIKLGSHQYIIFGSYANQAAVEAAATAVDASCKGSLILSTGGTCNLWYMSADDTAASMTHS